MESVRTQNDSMRRQMSQGGVNEEAKSQLGGKMSQRGVNEEAK